MDREQDLAVTRAAEDRPPQEPAFVAAAVEPLALEGASPPRSSFRITAIVVALFLTIFVAALDQTIVSTAIPTITSRLHSASGYTWIGSAYILASASVSPVWVKLSDIWGRKPIMLLGLVLFFGGSILCALAPTMSALIAGRAVQGVGSGGAMPLVTITISDLFSLRRRSLLFSLTEVVWAVAGGIGPVLGGVLAEQVSWRWIFWINVPIAGTAFVLILLFLDVHDPRTRLSDGLRAVDWFGTVSVLGLTLMLLLGLNFGGVVASWSSAKVICLLVAGALLAVLFVVGEKRLGAAATLRPLVPISVLSQRTIVAAITASCLHQFVSIAAEYYLPLYLQSAQLASPTRSGLLILPLILTEAAAATAAGMLIHRTGEYRQVLQAGMVLTALGVALWTLLDARTSVAVVVGLQVVAGIGVGACFQPPTIAVQAVVPDQDDVASATAALVFLRNLATAVSVVAGGALFQNGVALREGALREAGMGAEAARELVGPDAAANVGLIGRIEDAGQREVVKDAFAWSLRNLWIMYACVAACGAAATLFIERRVLSKDHTETKTGLRKKGNEAVAEG
ncbi:Tetracycline resistance protein TetB/drug resistance transporter [Macrophomina phaseolina MS6]|uniref:Tetracycline resistance protein TetB/drug resistance transporter n=2 Tax=Macrophomina phaseolina TaxID=35725 RepID=K2RIB8_MACPH|nr:Tetracycline resistance protein TetB/drug resistance transporter [Macrophomina phaseolina MS6]KAH7026934.1 putative MFS transporter [Macrophomina phaseolina]